MCTLRWSLSGQSCLGSSATFKRTPACPKLGTASSQARNGGSPEPFDGVAELWVETLDVLASEDPAVQAAAADLLADEANFIDLARSPIWIAQEHVVIA